MMFLLDSNIAIASDPLGPSLEAGTQSVLRFLRVAQSNHHDLRTHHASLVDFGRIPDVERREARLMLFQRYELLGNPPSITSEQSLLLGTPAAGSNEAVDQELLAAVVGDAAEYLITEDVGLHRKARRMGVEDRVLHVADALSMLLTLHVPPRVPPPSVHQIKTHQLNLEDRIFDDLRADYENFDNWFRRAARSQRDAYVIEGMDGHAAICIVKTEVSGEYGIAGPLLKLCTFKVAADCSGQKYGELLLKTVFERSHNEGMLGLYVTVYEKHSALIALFEEFGFATIPDLRTKAGETVMAKPLASPSKVGALLSQQGWSFLPGCEANGVATEAPLTTHIRFGPPHLRLDGTTPFMVPIEPCWHRLLFPDAEPADGALFPAEEMLTQPFGNALRKAYLCNSATRMLKPGDPLLFYRSGDEQAVFVVGVCESTLVSRNPAQIAAAVGQRTVYSLHQIEDLARAGEVLAVVFRQDRVLQDDPIRLDDARRAGLVKSWPQSIMRVQSKGVEWLIQRLGV